MRKSKPTVTLVTVLPAAAFFYQFKDAEVNTALTTGMICLFLMGAMVFGKFMMLAGLPGHLLTWVSGLQIPPLGVLVVVLVIYIILGCIPHAPSMLDNLWRTHGKPMSKNGRIALSGEEVFADEIGRDIFGKEDGHGPGSA